MISYGKKIGCDDKDKQSLLFKSIWSDNNDFYTKHTNSNTLRYQWMVSFSYSRNCI